jgi:opacity protein-like surface antigen
MSLLSRTIAVLAVGALSLAPATAAYAQEPGTIPVPLAEISGGYVFMHDFTEEEFLGLDGVDFPGGWYFSGAVNPTRWFGVVGEVSGSYKNHFGVTAGPYQVNGDLVGPFRISNDAWVHTFMGGPRFFGKVGRVVPFGQFLVGAARMRLKTQFPAELGIDTVEDSTTQFAMQPGGGVTVYLTERVGVRLAADYRTIIDFSDDGNEYTHEVRMIGGFTLHWGGR